MEFLRLSMKHKEHKLLEKKKFKKLVEQVISYSSQALLRLNKHLRAVFLIIVHSYNFPRCVKPSIKFLWPLGKVVCLICAKTHYSYQTFKITKVHLKFSHLEHALPFTNDNMMMQYIMLCDTSLCCTMQLSRFTGGLVLHNISCKTPIVAPISRCSFSVSLCPGKNFGWYGVFLGP